MAQGGFEHETSMTDETKIEEQNLNDSTQPPCANPFVVRSAVFNEDCIAVMKRYPDKFFHLAIVDVPYGLKEDGRNDEGRVRVTHKWKNPKAKGYKKGDWDNDAPDMEYFNELRRVSKNQIVWGANHFISKLPIDSPCWIFWDKQTSGDFADGELAWTSFKTAVRKFTWLWSGFKQKQIEQRIHPTQKPVALYRWLLQNYASEGDLILDTHVGSGSSRIAAKMEGFEFYGCEIDKDYYEAQEARWKNFISQQKLF